MFKRVKATVALSRKAEEFLYERALDEFESGDIRRGLWAQALAESQGDEARAKGHYLKLRVRSFLDEGAIVDHMSEAERQPNPEPPAQPRGVDWSNEQDDVRPAGQDQSHGTMAYSFRLILALLLIFVGVMTLSYFIMTARV